MRSAQERLRPTLGRLQIQPSKYDWSGQSLSSGVTNLSPGLQPNTPPTAKGVVQPPLSLPLRIGNHILLEAIDSNLLPGFQLFRAVDLITQQASICKAMPVDKYRDLLMPYSAASLHKNIVCIENVVVGSTHAYVFFVPTYGDLHAYLRSSGRLTELEASRLFHQLVSAVKHCHDHGIVLRDMKLRKCLFSDALRSEIKLSGLEDAIVLSDVNNDRMLDKHGCPAYVSPEILHCTAIVSDKLSTTNVPANETYSGRAADIWSLGVILYTMLVGRYPFQDVEPSALFARIAVGRYVIPSCLSVPARGLIQDLLTRDPEKRLTAGEILRHPWFAHVESSDSSGMDVDNVNSQNPSSDQSVPELADGDGDVWFNMGCT